MYAMHPYLNRWLDEADGQPEKKAQNPPQKPQQKPKPQQHSSNNKALEAIKGKNQQAFEYISQILKSMPTLRDLKGLEDSIKSLKDEVSGLNSDLQNVKTDVASFLNPTPEQRQDFEAKYSAPFTTSPKQYFSSMRDVVNEYPSAQEYLNISGNNFREYLNRQ